MILGPICYRFQQVTGSNVTGYNKLLVPICYWIQYVTSYNMILGPVFYRFQNVTGSNMSLGPTSYRFQCVADSYTLTLEVRHFDKISTDMCFLYSM
jgi:hypothetical protein